VLDSLLNRYYFFEEQARDSADGEVVLERWIKSLVRITGEIRAQGVEGLYQEIGRAENYDSEEVEG